MSRRMLLLSILFVFIVASSSMVNSVKGQTNGLDFRFQAMVEGQCIIAYGGIGPGVPDPMIWSGIGKGHATVGGHARDATAFPSSVAGLYISEDIRATGTVSVSWTEADGSEHRLAAMYSTATSEGLFYPSGNQFTLPIGGYSPGTKFLRFKGVCQNGSTTGFVSGIALFSAGIYGNLPGGDGIIVVLIDEQSGTLFLFGWSRTSTPTPFPPGYVRAANIYKSIVKIT